MRTTSARNKPPVMQQSTTASSSFIGREEESVLCVLYLCEGPLNMCCLKRVTAGFFLYEDLVLVGFYISFFKSFQLNSAHKSQVLAEHYDNQFP